MESQIELRQLRYFLVLARELHFGRAADAVGISQGPFSQQIQQLEKRIGVPLFQRTTRSVRLSPAGVRFLEHGVRVMEVLEEAVRHARAAHGATGGRLRIGAINIAANFILPEALRRFRVLHPGMVVEVKSVTTASQIALLRDGEIDIALVRPVTVPASLSVSTVCSEALCVAVHRSHPLACRSSVTLRDLEDQSLLVFQEKIGTDYSKALREALRREGLHSNIAGEFYDTLGGLCLAAGGEGLAILPESSRSYSLPDLVFLPLDAPALGAELIMVHEARDSSTPLMDMVRLIRTIGSGPALWSVSPDRSGARPPVRAAASK